MSGRFIRREIVLVRENRPIGYCARHYSGYTDLMNTTQSAEATKTSHAELLRSWKVRTTTTGAILTINGREFDIGATAAAMAFELERAALGMNAPELEHTEGSEAGGSK